MATPAKAKARKTTEGVRSSAPPVATDTPRHGTALESLPNWDRTRRALVLDDYDPGTEYIEAAARDEAASKFHPPDTAAELNQQGLELADAVEAKSSSNRTPSTSRNGKKR